MEPRLKERATLSSPPEIENEDLTPGPPRDAAHVRSGKCGTYESKKRVDDAN
jgi:hypothetical protein